MVRGARKGILAFVIACALVAAIGAWFLTRESSRPTSAKSATPTGADAGARPSRTPAVSGHVPAPPRHDAPAPVANRASKPLVGLFDTDRLCEQHSEAHCAAMRAATVRCDAGDGDGCRAALALVDSGPLRDLNLAVLFARRACEVGGSCARSQALDEYRRAGTDPAARRAAVAACTAGDAVACAFVAHTASDDGEVARYAELACHGGVIALGGCIDVSLSRPASRAPLEHACTSGSADGCYLLGRRAFEQGDVDAARVALARSCELSPGNDACNALETLERAGTLDE